MTTPDALLNVARSQLGYVEGKNNATKYGAWYGMNNVAWCAMFVSWCAHQAGFSTSSIPKHAYTPSGAEFFQKQKRWFTRPAVGDIVYYKFPGMGRISHVGIVETVHKDGSITAIEGNTDEAGGRTGGKVMRKKRSSYIAGYGRPTYVTTNTALKLPETPTDHGSLLHRGQTLTPGHYLSNGSQKLVLQGDGNLVLYRDRTAVWATGARGDTLTVQADGNLVLTRSGRPVWASHTSGLPTHLALQGDGNLVLYGALWASGTVTA